MLWMTKKSSQEVQVKTFVKNFLSWKPAEFYLRRIIKLPDELQEMIQNDGEYPIG